MVGQYTAENELRGLVEWKCTFMGDNRESLNFSKIGWISSKLTFGLNKVMCRAQLGQKVKIKFLLIMSCMSFKIQNLNKVLGDISFEVSPAFLLSAYPVDALEWILSRPSTDFRKRWHISKKSSFSLLSPTKVNYHFTNTLKPSKKLQFLQAANLASIFLSSFVANYQ